MMCVSDLVGISEACLADRLLVSRELRSIVGLCQSCDQKLRGEVDQQHLGSGLELERHGLSRKVLRDDPR